MSFKYWKKQLTIWASNGQVMGFLRLLIFADMRFSIDRKSLVAIEYQLNETACNSFFFISNLRFFFLDFNVDHSKPMRLSFCHVLSWFANITNSKPNKKKKKIESLMLTPQKKEILETPFTKIENFSKNASRYFIL